MEESDLIFREEVYAIVGAAMEVHSVLGNGFLEAVYQSAFKLELAVRQIPFEVEKELPVFYKGQKLETFYRADLICYSKIIVELKSTRQTHKQRRIATPKLLESNWFPCRLADQLWQSRQTRVEEICQVIYRLHSFHEVTQSFTK